MLSLTEATLIKNRLTGNVVFRKYAGRDTEVC